MDYACINQLLIRSIRNTGHFGYRYIEEEIVINIPVNKYIFLTFSRYHLRVWLRWKRSLKQGKWCLIFKYFNIFAVKFEYRHTLVTKILTNINFVTQQLWKFNYKKLPYLLIYRQIQSLISLLSNSIIIICLKTIV